MEDVIEINDRVHLTIVADERRIALGKRHPCRAAAVKLAVPSRPQPEDEDEQQRPTNAKRLRQEAKAQVQPSLALSEQRFRQDVIDRLATIEAMLMSMGATMPEGVPRDPVRWAY